MKDKVLFVNFPSRGGVKQFSLYFFESFLERYKKIDCEYHQYTNLESLRKQCINHSKIIFCSNNVNIYKLLPVIRNKELILINHDNIIRNKFDIKEVVLFFLYKKFNSIFKKVVIHQSVRVFKPENEIIKKMPFHDDGQRDLNRIKILQYGRIEKYKNIKYLIEAINNNPRFELIIAGKGKLSKYECDIINNSNNITLINAYISESLADSLFTWCDYVSLIYSDVTQTGLVDLAGKFKKPVILSNILGFSEHFDKEYSIIANIKDKNFGFLDEISKAHLIYEQMSVKSYENYLLSIDSWVDYCKTVYSVFDVDTDRI